MIILGVDPGTASTGYGVINVEGSPQLIDYGCLRTSSTQDMTQRLRGIYQQVKDIVEARPLGEAKVKGKYKAAVIYELIGLK